MNEVILYTTHCPKCMVLEAKLKEKNINYYTCDDLDLMEQKGFVSAPMLVTDGKIMTFGEAIQWLKGQNMEGDCSKCKLT